SVIVAVTHGDYLLLTQYANRPGATRTALIAGFTEFGETAEQTVHREVMEEVALEAVSVKLLGAYPFARKNEIIIGYHVQARGEIRLNEELAEYRLVRPEQLRPWPQATGLAVRDWMLARGMVVPEIAEGNLFVHADI
ncbi:MAG: hypothetical protein RJB37_4068, partial [Pseudomonadota bacterium]